MTRYKDYIYSDEGEAMLVTKLKHLFTENDIILGFINLCTSYIIVQNYSKNINC
jgi:hypothetical protein